MNLIETYNGSGLYAQYATSADYASNGQPLSAALTAVPDTYLQNTDLSTEDGKVTAISGIPLSAGGSVPEGVMSESGLEYNAVNEISGYNGSAIAQYGAEKQWLTHDDTIVHVANSAQYAFGVNLSGISADLARMMGVDETVLWEGTAFTPAGSNNPMQTSVQLSEDVFNFTKLQLVFSGGQVFRECITVLPYTGNDAIFYNYKPELNNPLTYLGTKYKLTDSTTLSGKCSYGNTQNIEAMTGGYWGYGGVCKVIGIGRKN